jgi:Tail tubular protein
MGLANQAMTPGRTSLLEAANICLAVIGEAPVNTLETQQVGEAAQAERTLLEYHKEGQTRGWSWNRERAVAFHADSGTGEILIPADVVKWAPSRLDWNNRFQARGSRIYDSQLRTYDIGQTVGSLDADIVSLLPWDDCPEVFNRWATIRAARVFSNRAVGNTTTYQLTQADEDQAWADLLRVDTEQGQPNAVTGEEAWATFRPAMGLGRRRGGGGGWGTYDGSSLVDLGGTGTGTVNLPQALGQDASPTFAGLALSAFSTFTGQLCVLGTNGAINPLPLGSGLSIVGGALVAAASLSDSTPQSLGTAAAGTASTASRSDHRHAMPTAADLGAASLSDAAAMALIFG